MYKLNKSEKGFTIIEVVVVLAIAGLIFGIVFWALPNLQRSNRDSSRRTIASNVLANLDQYASNNNGQYPVGSLTGTNNFEDFLLDFFSGGIADPLAGDWVDTGGGVGANALLSASTSGTGLNVDDGDDDTFTLMYATSARCTPGTAGAMEAGSGTRAIAIAVELEQGTGYCVDNN